MSETERRPERGTRDFRQTNLALFAAGLATFALLYCVQPLMPVFSAAFHISAARASLSLSITTLPLAFAMLVASALSEAIGRKQVMVASLFASAALATLSGFASSFALLLLLRGLMGLTLSGLPAVAMAYVAEEMHPKDAGLAMGLYIGGSAIGGMSGRLLSAWLTGLVSWHAALLAIGLEGLICGLLLLRFLPASRYFQPRVVHPGVLLRNMSQHMRNNDMRALFAEGFLIMGSFVTLYNYISYRLVAAPFGLNQSSMGAIFSVYIVGVFTGPYMGHLALRLGRRLVLRLNLLLMLAGLVLTLSANLAIVVAGITLFTAGFFGAHAVASAWVGAAATRGRAQASAMYLFAYYSGSSLVGTLGGMVWHTYGWPGVAALAGTLLLAAQAITAFRLQPAT